MQIPDCANAYVKFQLVAGEDWQLLDGLEEGITQAARVSTGMQRWQNICNMRGV